MDPDSSPTRHSEMRVFCWGRAGTRNDDDGFLGFLLSTVLALTTLTVRLWPLVPGFNWSTFMNTGFLIAGFAVFAAPPALACCRLPDLLAMFGMGYGWWWAKSLICVCNPNPNSIEFRELEEMEEYVLNGIAEWFPVCGVDATITATSFRYPRRQLSLLGVFFFFFYVFLLLKISFWYLIAII